MDKISQGASLFYLNGRFKDSFFCVDSFTANGKHKFNPQNKVIEPVEMTFCAQNSFPTFKKCKFSEQENISCEFYEVKLGKQGFALRHKYKFGVTNSLPATDKHTFGATNSLPATNKYKFGGQNSFTALNKHKFGTPNSLPATNKHKFGTPNSFTALDKCEFGATNSFPASNKYEFGAQYTFADFSVRVTTHMVTTAAQVVAKKYSTGGLSKIHPCIFDRLQIFPRCGQICDFVPPARPLTRSF